MWLMPQPEWIAGLLAIAAMWAVLRPLGHNQSAGFAGLFAGLAASLFSASGAGLPLAIGASIALLALAVLVFRKSTTISTRGAGWTLACVAGASVVFATVAGVIDGWRSAEALNRTFVEAEAISVPVWAALFAIVAIAAGVLRGVWKTK